MKFEKEKKYKNKVLILAPSSIVTEGQIKTGKEWEEILVYDVADRNFNKMFEEVDTRTPDYQSSNDSLINEMVNQ